MDHSISRHEDPDEDLIRLIQQEGDRVAFRKLYETYKDMVFNFCFRFTGNHADAADCTQEIFIKVYRHIDSFSHQSKFSTWLYQVMTNHCKDTVRSKNFKQRQNILSLTPAYADTREPLPKEVPDKQPDPEQLLQHKEQGIFIQRAIDQLEAKQKLVLILRDIEGKTYAEIAELTGLMSGTVKSTLARARFKVARMIRSGTQEQYNE